MEAAFDLDPIVCEPFRVSWLVSDDARFGSILGFESQGRYIIGILAFCVHLQCKVFNFLMTLAQLRTYILRLLTQFFLKTLLEVKNPVGLLN
ncbi:hypothetical protein Taro_022924 [Colocasia esculenta]|uniref:Uncharacterized protein n=1 Tax=Colocasia esculenta TaxID=4460 RepID=A0A843V9T0_COLES|nr:hypothetical protein [Colocasia esculenta]